MMAIADVDVKERLHQIADELPEGATWEDAAYRVYRLRELEARLRDLEEGRVHSQEEVEKLFLHPGVQPPREPDPKKRKQIMRELVEHMRSHPITGDAPRRFTRDELHERG